ncbi:beta-galactosidase [Larkinella terrae]|nr:beta-galactosidase [Larkinella terrae]
MRLILLFGLNALSLGGNCATTSPSFCRIIAPSSEPAPINRQRYIGITIFNFETDPRIDDERIEHSAAAGCNAVEITINWDRVYPTRQSTANWKVVDSHVQTAIRLGLKIALRIHVGREIANLGSFWGTSETMQAADGLRMNGGGITQFSYAHQPTVELAKNFVKETTQRYRYLQQQNRLLFISVVASPALESEFSPVHNKPDGTKYSAAFDYGGPMKLAFRQWLQGRFSLADLNKRWNTGFGDWNAVVPPTGSISDPQKLFSLNRQGQDWYVFRHRLLERFLNDMTNTLKGVDGSIRVVNQHGAVWDRLSGLRATYAFKSLNQNADGLKFNDGPTYNHRFSMDVVRSNLKPGAFMINAVDGMFFNSVSIDTYFNQVKECFQHGASMITLANFGGTDARATLSQLIQTVLDAGLLNQSVTDVQTGGTISYKLSEILRDTYSPISTRWTDQYNKSGKKPIQVNLIEDLFDETDNADEPAQPEKPVEDPKPSPTVSANYDGYLDKVECGTMRGWVWDRNDPDGSVTVEFSADGKVIGTTEADIYRSDLENAGKGNGKHAYSFTTPASLKDNKTHQISAKVCNSSFTLKYAPKSLTCAPSARLSAGSAESKLEVTILGNPVQEQLSVEVRGAEGKPLRFQISDLGGRIVSERIVEIALGVENQQFRLGSEVTGLLILRVIGGQQAVTVKLLKY